jgi:hypothetical protein
VGGYTLFFNHILKYLPSKRLIPIVLIIFTLVAGLFWYSFGKSSQNNVYVNPAFSIEIKNDADSDFDKDGLKDWEEALWGTDPKNPDTDGDKTGDGKEIELKRDPLVKGPNDSYEPRLFNSTAEKIEKNNDFNLTSQVTDALGGSIGPRILAGGNKDSVSPVELAAAVGTLPKPDDILDNYKKFSRRDLKISPNSTSSSIKDYFNRIYGVYEKTFLTLKKDDLTILAEVLPTENYERLIEIDDVISAFDESINRIKAIPVPVGYETFAVEELNYLSKTKRVVEAFRNAEQDPLSALVLLQRRISLMDEVKQFHQETKESLAQNGISFEPNENGYLFFQ